MTWLIYGLLDPRTRMVRYIGKSTTGMSRPNQHRRKRDTDRTHCANWVRELQRVNFDFETTILETVEPGLLERLSQTERWWIAYGHASGWPLTNLTDGGEGAVTGDRHPMKKSESRRAMGQRSRLWWTPERKQHFSEMNPSKDPGVRRIQAETSRARMSTPEARLEMKSRLCTPEQLAARSSRWLAKNPMSDPALRLKATRNRWTDAERVRTGVRMRTANPMKRDEMRELSRTRMHARWKDPEFRASKTGDSNPMKRDENRAKFRGDQNPAKRPESREKIKSSWTDERRAAASERMRLRNLSDANPSKKKKR